MVAEINLPSGVRPKMCELSVSEGGDVLELTCEWPSYLSNPREFSGKWLPNTGDGSLRPGESRIVAAQQKVQENIREYGARVVKSTARIVLPREVSDDMNNVKVYHLGFEDQLAKEGEHKANGCALQVCMLAVEDFPSDLFADSTSIQFERVKRPTVSATVATGAGLDAL